MSGIKGSENLYGRKGRDFNNFSDGKDFTDWQRRLMSLWTGFVPQLKQSRRLNRKFIRNMACDVENSEKSIEGKIRVARPATDAFVAEAVEALRAGKVFVVSTDTLYGYACDA
ncbi:hypothetical protein K1719_040376 [Acacia pycnantha]|nr:hypothetical protein K1719_040376 [Acacia pycnantha]